MFCKSLKEGYSHYTTWDVWSSYAPFRRSSPSCAYRRGLALWVLLVRWLLNLVERLRLQHALRLPRQIGNQTRNRSMNLYWQATVFFWSGARVNVGPLSKMPSSPCICSNDTASRCASGSSQFSLFDVLRLNNILCW